jgi:hypothetical protein
MRTTLFVTGQAFFLVATLFFFQPIPAAAQNVQNPLRPNPSQVVQPPSLQPSAPSTGKPQATTPEKSAEPRSKRERSNAQKANDERMRACGKEWRENKDKLKAAGKTWKTFGPECRAKLKAQAPKT